LDVLEDFVKRLEHVGAEIIRDKIPEVESSKHFGLDIPMWWGCQA
jgi:hypothetical protein